MISENKRKKLNNDYIQDKRKKLNNDYEIKYKNLNNNYEFKCKKLNNYYSQDYVRRKIIRQTDQEIIEQDMLIKKEIENGTIPDPNAPIDPATGMPMDQQTANMNLGQPVMEPDVTKDADATQVKDKTAELSK